MRGGPFPNYQAFVQPAQQQQQFNKEQQQNIDQLQINQQQLYDNQLQNIPLQQGQGSMARMQINPPTVVPTGIGSVYNNMSHY